MEAQGKLDKGETFDGLFQFGLVGTVTHMAHRRHCTVVYHSALDPIFGRSRWRLAGHCLADHSHSVLWAVVAIVIIVLIFDVIQCLLSGPMRLPGLR